MGRVTVLRNAIWKTAEACLRTSEATASRAGWATGRSVALTPKGLALVVGDFMYTWDPHSVDMKATDWTVVLPLADA